MENERIFERVLDLLFPPKCIFCGKLTEHRRACPECEAKLPRFDGATPTKEFFTKCVAPFRYDGAIREALLRFKFGGREQFAAPLAVYAAETVRRELDRYDIISWAPVSTHRRRERGYDQAELLARETAKLLGTSAVPLLKKRRDTPPQSGFTDRAARRANVMGAYSVRKNVDVAGKTVLLIDDIVTTGATLSECSRELLMAGAAEVVCCVIAVADNG